MYSLTQNPYILYTDFSSFCLLSSLFYISDYVIPCLALIYQFKKAGGYRPARHLSMIYSHQHHTEKNPDRKKPPELSHSDKTEHAGQSDAWSLRRSSAPAHAHGIRETGATPYAASQQPPTQLTCLAIAQCPRSKITLEYPGKVGQYAANVI